MLIVKRVIVDLAGFNQILKNDDELCGSIADAIHKYDPKDPDDGLSLANISIQVYTEKEGDTK